MDVTAEQILEFADMINRARVEMDLKPITVWEVTECEPSNVHNCLSAHHLMADIGGATGTAEFQLHDPGSAKRLAAALGSSTFEYGYNVLIPSAIKEVTDPFDALGQRSDSEVRQQLEILRDQFVDAGLEAL